MCAAGPLEDGASPLIGAAATAATEQHNIIQSYNAVCYNIKTPFKRCKSEKKLQIPTLFSHCQSLWDKEKSRL